MVRNIGSEAQGARAATIMVQVPQFPNSIPNMWMLMPHTPKQYQASRELMDVGVQVTAVVVQVEGERVATSGRLRTHYLGDI